MHPPLNPQDTGTGPTAVFGVPICVIVSKRILNFFYFRRSKVVRAHRTYH